MNEMNKRLEIVNLTALMASPIELWRDQWFRNGKMRISSHPSISSKHIISKTLREMRDNERTLRMDMWNKCQRHYPRIQIESFREVFNSLIGQAYYGLREDLEDYIIEKEVMRKNK